MKSVAPGTSGADSLLRHKKLSPLLKQILMVVMWLVLFHYLNFHLDVHLQQKQFASVITRSIDDAVPNGINEPDDVYRLLGQLQSMQDPSGPMASSMMLAGGILLRQMRVVSRKCSHDVASVGVTSCAPMYSELDEEQEFKPWNGRVLSQEVLQLPEYSWKSADISGDIPSQGMPASGFTLRLATALDTAAAIERMKKNIWIDTKTRGIFVTGCFYNNVAKMIACTRTAVLIGTTGLYVVIGVCHEAESYASLTPQAGMNHYTVFLISRSNAPV